MDQIASDSDRAHFARAYTQVIGKHQRGGLVEVAALMQVLVEHLEILEGDFPDLFELGLFRDLAIGCGDRIDQLSDGYRGIGVPPGELVV